jgi:hypothetical protein
MSNEFDRGRAELQVLLAEYKQHYDEVYKWHSYRHQALGGYFVVLSILATIISNDQPHQWISSNLQVIPIVLAVLSVVLLYILLQYRFAIVRNVIYLESYIVPRLLKLSADEVLEDLSVNNRYRDRYPSMKWLTKFGVEIVAYIVFFGSFFGYLGWFAYHVCRCLSESFSFKELLLPAGALLMMLASAVVVVHIACFFSILSKDEQKANGFRNQDWPEAEQISSWHWLCTSVASYFKAEHTRRT